MNTNAHDEFVTAVHYVLEDFERLGRTLENRLPNDLTAAEATALLEQYQESANKLGWAYLKYCEKISWPPGRN